MILQALAEYYDVLAEQGKVGKSGWGTAKVIGALCLDNDGHLTNILSLKVANAKGKELPVVKNVPEQVTRTAGVKANFLCDGPSYFLGFDAKGNAKRAKQCFDAAAALHLSILDGVDSVAAHAIFEFFTNWDPDAADPLIAEYEALLKEAGNFIFRVNGDFAQNDPKIREAWEQYRSQDADGVVMQCAITGQKRSIARLHTMIKGVRGAQSSGASLVSFNAPAFESYGQTQSYNAPVSEQAMFAYTTALNYLLADKDHTAVLGDTTVVAWSASGEPEYNDIFSLCVSDDTPNTVTDSTLKAMLEALSHGRTYLFNDLEIDPNQPFYILGLSPNAARLSVRFFWKNTFGQFAKNLHAHYDRLEIVRPSFDEREYLSVGRLLYETVNKKSKDKSASPVLVGGLMQSILNNTFYPSSLLSVIMLRIRAERNITRGQAALLKAILLKNSSNIAAKEICTVSLNKESNYTPYVLGRLFAVFEGIQYAANPNINSTIKDRFFSSAAGTPSIIFPRLTQLAQAHLRKLSVGQRIWYEKQLAELHALLPEHLPDRFTLSEQESFFIGYYHQNHERFTTKKEENENE